MDVRVTRREDGAVSFAIAGRVDASTYKGLQREVDALDGVPSRVVFGFRDVDYTSSAGLCVLMSAGKKVGGDKVSIVNVSEEVLDALHTVGFDAVFNVSAGERGIATYIGSSFKEILASQARRLPDVGVVTHLGERYTWADIDACAQIVAHDLSRMGVGKGTHVGICSANSPNWIIAFFATQKLGAIACLMNFNSKPAADFGTAGDCFIYCAYNSHWEDHAFELPIIPAGRSWCVVVDSADESLERAGSHVEGGVRLGPRSCVVLVGERG